MLPAGGHGASGRAATRAVLDAGAALAVLNGKGNALAAHDLAGDAAVVLAVHGRDVYVGDMARAACRFALG